MGGVDIERLLREGLARYGQGDLDGAIECWEGVQVQQPDHPAARDYLETVYEERFGSVEAGRSRSKAAAAGGPDEDDDTATFDTGESFEDLNAVPLPESDPDTRISEALAAYQNEDLERAWDLLQAVAKESPDRLDVQGYLGLVRGRQAKNFARVIGDKSRALQLKRSVSQLKGLNLKP